MSDGPASAKATNARNRPRSRPNLSCSHVQLSVATLRSVTTSDRGEAMSAADAVPEDLIAELGGLELTPEAEEPAADADHAAPTASTAIA